MKKIVFLITLTLIGSACMAQRGGGERPGSGGHARTSVSARTSSPSRNSVSANRSASSYRPSSQTTVNRHSEPRSNHGTVNYTPSARNTPRSHSNEAYSRPGDNHRPVAAQHHGAPNNTAPYRHQNYHPVPHGMHPAPPAYHPANHHRPIHMHHCVYYDWRVHNLYWHGYWAYVHTHPYEEVVVYVNNTRPSTTVVAVTADENYVYTIYRDELLNETYFTISDKDDNVLVKTLVNKKYCRIVADGNGVWLLKKKDKDPIYFIYQDGNLYRYEED